MPEQGALTGNLRIADEEFEPRLFVGLGLFCQLSDEVAVDRKYLIVRLWCELPHNLEPVRDARLVEFGAIVASSRV